MGSKAYFFWTALVFLIIAVLHGLRIWLGWESMIGGWEVPMWLSWAAVILAGWFAYSGFKQERRIQT